MEVIDVTLPRAGSFHARYLASRFFIERVAIMLALPLILPLCGLIAVAVRLDSPGPILYRQLRPGIGESVFMILKFRSMYVQLCDDGRCDALDGDRRVTRIGRLLRMSHLDELPQFWNILRGEMSLIGPRPTPLCQTAVFESVHPEYRQRRSLRPGITGWAQVHLGYTDGIDGARRKLNYDLYYIRNASLRLDLSILTRSFIVLLTARGAR